MKTGVVDLKIKLHKIYRAFKPIYCRVIKEKVIFNNHGWKHISFDGKGHRRYAENIRMRLHLLQHARYVVKSGMIIKDDVREVIINNKKLKIRFVELACDICEHNKHVTVIIRKIENNTFHYYSIRRTKNKIKRLLKKQKSP